jgi:D-alanine-D-alanine ligase
MTCRISIRKLLNHETREARVHGDLIKLKKNLRLTGKTETGENMDENKLTVGVIFGGRSVEHDVSIITGLQVIQAIDRTKYEVEPIYVSKSGEWYIGETLLDIRSFREQDIEMIGARRAAIPPDRGVQGIITPITSGLLQRTRNHHLDVVFPAIHGTHGEDGTLQGLLELADLPYVGCGVSAAALGMNKALAKQVLRHHGVPVLDFTTVTSSEWRADPERVKFRLAKVGIGYPLFAKPSNLGSSIGISQVTGPEKLSEALEIVFAYDDLAVLEKAAGEVIEVNCAVIRSLKEYWTSTCEQPVSWQEFLTYEDKYMRRANLGMKGAERRIPAPISDALTHKVEETAQAAFAAIGGYGLARVDSFVNEATGEVWVNELNTVPGSMSFYLWEPKGLTPTQIVDRLIEIALEVHANKQKRIFTYDAGLLDKAASQGIKLGVKGKSAPVG